MSKKEEKTKEKATAEFNLDEGRYYSVRTDRGIIVGKLLSVVSVEGGWKLYFEKPHTYVEGGIPALLSSPEYLRVMQKVQSEKDLKNLTDEEKTIYGKIQMIQRIMEKQARGQELSTKEAQILRALASEAPPMLVKTGESGAFFTPFFVVNEPTEEELRILTGIVVPGDKDFEHPDANKVVVAG